MVIAGPCSAESEEQVMTTAAALKAAGVSVFRAGVWKPRTRPGCFEGWGKAALPWLQRVKNELGMKVCTEVASKSHVEACLSAGIDLVWTGARTTANPFLVQEIAEALKGTDVPVLIKNPVNPDLELWTGAVERFRGQGIGNLGIVHRGFSTFEKTKYRNSPYWSYALEMRKRFPELPFFCDPSHMAGKAEYIREISQHAMDLGLDGLMIESHCNPSCALSDAAQQITPEKLSEMLSNLSVRLQSTPEADSELAGLRANIISIDEGIVRLLGERMQISREIGKVKKDNNIAVIQTARWEEVLSDALHTAGVEGLDDGFIERVFNVIHDASVAEQNKVLES